ncbi:MAG: (R)-hydratase [Rhodobacteraceae bacterium]|jgi:3-hydroxybutyryl-CoA dehydratase|nr:(R)-hydratase [Paracoccaceae bacterium]|tara:strand:+ start:1115 stop:1549 length:435 start_codon:yes stop_codon:yes gene_type:complete
MNRIGTIYLEDMEIGLSRSIAKVMGDVEIESFAKTSEDRNPIHLNDEAGKASIFKSRVVHGMLSASLFSALLGEYLPGHGAIYLSQTLQFTKPVYPGDKVVASVTVININNNKKQVTLKCEAKVGDKLVIKGEAVALAPSRGEN